MQIQIMWIRFLENRFFVFLFIHEAVLRFAQTFSVIRFVASIHKYAEILIVRIESRESNAVVMSPPKPETFANVTRTNHNAFLHLAKKDAKTVLISQMDHNLLVDSIDSHRIHWFLDSSHS